MANKTTKPSPIVAVETPVLQTYVLPEQGITVVAASAQEAAKAAKKATKE